MRQILGVLLAVVLTFGPLIVNGNKCPPPEGIMPCRCRGRNDQIQVWCSHSDLERVNGALENLMRLRNLPAIDELIVENNRMPSLPARAFGSLQIGRLLLRHNGLESISRNSFAGLEDSIEELYIVEDKLIDFPFDTIEQLHNLEAFTIEKSKIRLLPRFNGLNNLKHIRIDGSLISGLPVGAFARMASVKQIHLVNSNLQSLPEGIFGSLETLILANFTGNRIDIIQRKSFALLPKLEVLSLVNNRLEDAVSVGKACEVLTSLKSLDLSMNKFKILPEGSFVNLRTLQILNLMSNKIQNVSPRSFTHLPALRKVDLSGNELRNFPKTLFESTPLLEELRMQQNYLSTPSEIGQILTSLKSLRFLDLGGNGITILPTGSLIDHTQLQKIDLSNNRISKIENGAFNNMLSLIEINLKNNTLTQLPSNNEVWSIPSLKELDVSYNQLQSLSSTTLEGLPNLRLIDLSFNNIKIIGSLIFHKNKILEELNLSDNIIQQFSNDGLNGLSKLNLLDLSHNHLENIPNDIFYGLKKLRKLNLGNNRISILPANVFIELKTLENLSLKNNAINIFPLNIFSSLENLKELNLKHNSISKINNQILIGLKNLEILKLSSNKINHFDNTAFDDLEKLRMIDLSSNRINKIPTKSFQNLPSLEKFEARENRITTIENGAFGNSNKIEVLDLANNALSEISSMIISKISLKVIDLSHNIIENIQSDTFKRAINLMELYLNDNRIQHLNSSMFSNLEALTIIDMDGNDLKEILPLTFTNLPKLIYLRMSRNKIRTINKQSFSNLNSLDGLDLQENELETISEYGFEKTNSLKYLNLSHNNFDSIARMGLFPLQSLEVLDISFNRIREIDDKSLRHLQWLVELRINDNGICRIPLGVFDGMSRLKMLILRNNFLTHLYESVFYKLKNNIAFLDISGNPISCDCELIWLRNLMNRDAVQELSDSTCESPNELKGLHIKNIRPGRMICSSNDSSNRIRGVVPQKYNDADCPTLSISKRKPRPVVTYDKPIDKPLFGSGSIDFDSNSDYVDATSTNQENFKNRRKDEKLIESNDYNGASDTPTIYASSGSSSKKSGSTGSISTPALNGLSTLFGIPLPSLDFGLNLGISPSLSLTEKDLEDPEQNNRVFINNFKGPDPLPPSWLDRPSKEEHIKNSNLYEPPEYIPRKPIQPYIPLNPYAESNTRANILSSSDTTGEIIRNSNTKRNKDYHHPLSPLSLNYPTPNISSRPIRFPQSETIQIPGSSNNGGSGQIPGTTSSIQSWHPAYPNTETGFIPIEPFFHNSKNSKSPVSKSITNLNNQNNVPVPLRNETSTSSINFFNFDNIPKLPIREISSQQTRLPSKTIIHIDSTTTTTTTATTTLAPPPQQTSSQQEGGDYDDDISYTPVYIQNGGSSGESEEIIKPNENNNKNTNNQSGLSDFWNMFTKKTENNNNNNKTIEGTDDGIIIETLLKSSNDEITTGDPNSFPPLNFSAPIDTEIETNNNEFISQTLNTQITTTESNSIVPLPIPMNELANSFSSSNQIPLEASDGSSSSSSSRRPTAFGKSTITKIRLEETQNGGSSIQQHSYNNNNNNINPINTMSRNIPIFPNMNTNNIIDRKNSGLPPPVVIGEQEEPLDWYYTNYNNPHNPGEELEKYLERNRATRLDDVLIGSGTDGTNTSIGNSMKYFNIWKLWTLEYFELVLVIFSLHYHIL